MQLTDAVLDPEPGCIHPGASVTLSGGWIWNRVVKKGVPVKEKAGSILLVDTGALYNDFDWEITGR